jgi:hypothetical protein
MKTKLFVWYNHEIDQLGLFEEFDNIILLATHMRCSWHFIGDF